MFAKLRLVSIIPPPGSKLLRTVPRVSRAIAAPVCSAHNMECVGALDQGTQSTRFYVFDKSMHPIAHYQLDLPQHYPQPGWCEHDPMVIWQSAQECIEKGLQAAKDKVGPINIKGLGITNQRETTIVWSRSTGRPLHNAIVWHDNRTSGLCARMEHEHGGKQCFRPITGLPISTYFAGFKYLWLYENVPAVKEAADSGDAIIGTVDSWLIYKLTGGKVHVTDVSNASRTLLMDLASCKWHPKQLELFHVPASALPRIVSNSEEYGTVAEGALAGTPIAGCLGDQMAAMMGQRCVKGEAKNTYGTGCFMLLNTGSEITPSSHGLLTTVSYQLGPNEPVQYALEGSIAVAGLGVSWLRDSLGIISTAAESETLAASVPNTGGIYFVPAFSGLLAPYWRDDARGTIMGLTGGSTKAHICRAMLEAICFQTREVLDAMRADAKGMELRALRVDGGATENKLLLQLQADILQVPVVRPDFCETTSLGAALAAGLATGVWTKEEVFRHDDGKLSEYRPACSVEDAEHRYGHWKKAIQKSMDLGDLAH